MNGNELIKILKGDPEIFLVFGEEDFLVEETIEKTKSHFLKEEDSGFNYDHLDGAETDLQTMLDICYSFPMMSERRIVLVRNFDKLFSGRTAKNDAIQIEKYILKPSDTTRLILQGAASTVKNIGKNINDKRGGTKKLDSLKFPFNLLIKNHAWIEYPKMYESDFPRWIEQRLKSKGKSTTPESIDLLIAHCNPELRAINSEIEKLLIYIGERKKIDIEDINSLTGANRAYNVFELQKAVGRKDIEDSLKILFKMMSSERQEMLILTMLTRYFTILWQMIEQLRLHANNFKLAGVLGISPYFIDEYRMALQKYSSVQIEKAFVELCSADEKLKTSSTNRLLILEELLINLIED